MSHSNSPENRVNQSIDSRYTGGDVEEVELNRRIPIVEKKEGTASKLALWLVFAFIGWHLVFLIFYIWNYPVTSQELSLKDLLESNKNLFLIPLGAILGYYFSSS